MSVLLGESLVRHLFVALLASLVLVSLGAPVPAATEVVAGTQPTGRSPLALAPAGAAPGTVGPDPTRPPNILLISTDDQHADDLEHMPWTRQLVADQGALFTDAVSTDPLCCPARAVLATGLFNHNNGVLTNVPPFGGYAALENGEFADETIPTWLNRTTTGHDYETAFIGKFLNGYGGRNRDPQVAPAVPQGWDYFAAGVEGTGLYDFYGGDINVLDRSEGQREPVVEPAGMYRAYYNQQKVTARIEHAAANDMPFFIWQSELAPHSACWPQDTGRCTWGRPMVAPEDQETFADLPSRSRQDPSFNERVVADKPGYIQALPRYTPRRVGSSTETHRARIRSLQAVDRGVKQSIEKLASLGELDRTYVIFTSDNGHLNGEHRYQGKTVPYEGSLRVPLAIRGPGITPGTVVDDTVALVDLPATIADIADAEPTLARGQQRVPLDGRSLLPVIRGEARGWGTLPIEAGDKDATQPDQWWYRGVRTPRWTYVEYEQTGEAELYDHRRDPFQLDNVAYRTTHRAVRAALADKLDRLRGCSGEACHAVAAGGVPQPESDGTPVHPDQLGSLGDATQVLTLTGTTWNSTVGTAVAWRKVGRTWRVAAGPFRVRLGTEGLIRPGRARHLRGRTPAGTFEVAYAMGLDADPGGALRYRRLDDNDRWPFDASRPASYNVFQPLRTRRARWSEDAEIRFADARPRYRRVLVLRHNLPIGVYREPSTGERLAKVPADTRLGSLFLHSGSPTPRQGWVATETSRMRWLLRWLDPAREPKVVVGTPAYLRSRL